MATQAAQQKGFNAVRILRTIRIARIFRGVRITRLFRYFSVACLRDFPTKESGLKKSNKNEQHVGVSKIMLIMQLWYDKETYWSCAESIDIESVRWPLTFPIKMDTQKLANFAPWNLVP